MLETLVIRRSSRVVDGVAMIAMPDVSNFGRVRPTAPDRLYLQPRIWSCKLAQKELRYIVMLLGDQFR